MGGFMAGEKNKQRIGLDPQNKHWANDKSKFGYKLLQKMGWKEDKGLGLNEDGNREHIKVKLKVDNLGVGSDKKSIDNWMESTNSFSELLKSLNANLPVKAISEVPVNPIVDEEPKFFGRLYHRKNFIRNKTVSNYTPEALDMIMGIKPGSALASVPENKEEKIEENANIHIQKTSVNDYFASKLREKNLKMQTHLSFLKQVDDAVVDVVEIDIVNEKMDIEPKKSKKRKSDENEDIKHKKSKKAKKEKKEKKSKKHSKNKT